MKYKTVALYKLSVNSLMKKIIVDAPNGFLGVLKMGAISPKTSGFPCQYVGYLIVGLSPS